jgi:dTDP-3-amino-3,4,6-trideoxy-alpha-D-glucose transaminase
VQQVVKSGPLVPFVDLAPGHEGLKQDILADVAALIETGAFTNGPAVAEFEDAFAATCRVEHCVGVASGLDALRLGLVAAGIGAGDEVLVPAMTFIATYEAVSQTGALPVPVDISATDYCVDPEAAEAAVSARTRAIAPVHLYGQLADLCALAAIARRARLDIVEDACQAHGARRDGLRPGASSTAAAFSFYPGKNLGAMGDAGALVTESAELAERVRALREHGQTAKYRHDAVGYTARLDTVQALVLLRKLQSLETWNDQRRVAAAYYLDALEGVGDLVLPRRVAGSEPVWHLMAIRTAAPSRLAEHLAARGIATGRHYPEPPHLSAAYASLGYRRGAFPVAERLADQVLTLPLYPGITDEQLDRVVHGIREYFDG